MSRRVNEIYMPTRGNEYKNPDTGERATVLRVEHCRGGVLVHLDTRETWTVNNFLRCFHVAED